jgi:hypothetical protein
MSRMLEALRKIEAKQPRPRPRPAANKSPLKAPQAARTPVQEMEEPESPASHDVAKTCDETCDTEITELHPVIEEELDELRPSILSFSEPIFDPQASQSWVSDSFATDKTLARAESAMDSALLAEGPGIYDEMAQYILAQLTPGRPAALLFTSPGDCVEKSETLSLLSKTLADHFQTAAFILDALPDQTGRRNKKKPDISDSWSNLFEELKTLHQLVFIDAPSLAHAQTASMISKCDGVYLVIRLGYTRPYDVRESVRVIRQAGGRLLGSIVVE